MKCTASKAKEVVCSFFLPPERHSFAYCKTHANPVAEPVTQMIGQALWTAWEAWGGASHAQLSPCCLCLPLWHQIRSHFTASAPFCYVTCNKKRNGYFSLALPEVRILWMWNSVHAEQGRLSFCPNSNSFVTKTWCCICVSFSCVITF